jgi:hypothetical protein
MTANQPWRQKEHKECHTNLTVWGKKTRPSGLSPVEQDHGNLRPSDVSVPASLPAAVSSALPSPGAIPSLASHGLTRQPAEKGRRSADRRQAPVSQPAASSGFLNRQITPATPTAVTTMRCNLEMHGPCHTLHFQVGRAARLLVHPLRQITPARFPAAITHSRLDVSLTVTGVMMAAGIEFQMGRARLAARGTTLKSTTLARP